MKRNAPLNERLHGIALFAACTPHELELIDANSMGIVVKPGAVITSSGHVGHEFVVIVSGTAKVMVGDTHVATLGPGDFFGEVALLDSGVRTATIVAETEIDAQVSSHTEFNTILDGAHSVCRRLLVGLARRLRAADVLLSSSAAH